MVGIPGGFSGTGGGADAEGICFAGTEGDVKGNLYLCRV